MDKIYEEGIILHEQGIVQRDGIYFHYPTAFAKDHLICVLWGATDICDTPYRVYRPYLDAFMFTRILKGQLHYEYRGRRFVAGEGDIILQDCKHLNHYWAGSRVKLQFFHFTGGITQGYCDMLYEQTGAYFPNHLPAGLLFDAILTELQKASPSDHQLSYLVTDIFRLLATPRERTTNPFVAQAKQYMEEHFTDALMLNDICHHVSLSPYYFSRLFKRETEHSPHQYLMGVRMKHAQKLLSETNETIDNIAAACGFASTSHFIRAFKKEAGMTPATFRKVFE